MLENAIRSGSGGNADVRTGRPRRSETFLHALSFVVGFGIVFTLLGSAAGLLGQSLNSYLPLIQKLGAVMVVVFALTTLGVFRRLAQFVENRTGPDRGPVASSMLRVFQSFNALLYTERRVTDMHSVKRGWGHASSLLMGMTFSAGWVPCVGPILASILLVASDSATAVTGAIMLAVFSLGLGIPFLVTGAAFDRSSSALRRLNQHAGVVSLVSGLFLLYVAYLLWTDRLVSLTTRFSFLNDYVLNAEAAASSLFGFSGTPDIAAAGLAAGIPIALAAGLISFLSPCVLPLIPAYVGYLSGTSLAQKGD